MIIDKLRILPVINFIDRPNFSTLHNAWKWNLGDDKQIERYLVQLIGKNNYNMFFSDEIWQRNFLESRLKIWGYVFLYLIWKTYYLHFILLCQIERLFILGFANIRKCYFFISYIINTVISKAMTLIGFNIFIIF